jgi:hypothetical protein
MPRQKAQTSGQKATVARVMHEFKHGELPSGNGRKVRNPRQAIAIALSEAGASNRQSPSENREHLAKTNQKERKGQTAQAETEGTGAKQAASRGPTRKQLYDRAARAGVPGRSKMSKAELAKALH